MLPFLIITNQNRASMVMVFDNSFNVNKSELSCVSHGNFNNELSILLVTLFVGYQPIRIHHFPKGKFYYFKKNLSPYLKSFYQKIFEFHRVTLKEKRKYSVRFPY